jgi:hypothetical protein
MQREKGKRFERDIARVFREAWPGTVVRRSSQAERAYNSDIFVEGGPLFLSSLWLELQDAKNPTPLAKLEQAEGDIASQRGIGGPRHAIIIWHRLASRTVNVTLRACVFDALRGFISDPIDKCPVTLDLVDFISLMQRRTA